MADKNENFGTREESVETVDLTQEVGDLKLSKKERKTITSNIEEEKLSSKKKWWQFWK